MIYLRCSIGMDVFCWHSLWWLKKSKIVSINISKEKVMIELESWSISNLVLYEEIFPSKYMARKQLKKYKDFLLEKEINS